MQIAKINYQPAQRLFSAFAHLSGSIFFDSVQYHSELGRYSFIGADPFYIFSAKNYHVRFAGKRAFTNPVDLLAQEYSHFNIETEKGLPPFQGGVAGFFSYELSQYLEKLPRADNDDCAFPDCVLGFYDLVLGFDHLEKRAYAFSSGFPETEKIRQSKRAQKRLNWLLKTIKSAPEPSFSVYRPPTITSNFTHENYLRAVQKIIDYIFAGDIFEANLSQRFQAMLPKNLSSWQLYCQLRQTNPAPFSSFLNFGDTIIASASPERFLQCQNGLIETRPIKGTRKRSANPIEDKKLAAALIQSEKDNAENVMIVDLMRNDLSRVCDDHSVKTTQLCGLESFANVHHLVSVVEGRLSPNKTPVDVLKATFPGGSITGAPKIRAMEIIAELEPHVRGPYCGAIGYMGFDGSMDTSIVIRTYAIKNNMVTFSAGGAIVSDSDPEQEYEETLTKAQPLQHAMGIKSIKMFKCVVHDP